MYAILETGGKQYKVAPGDKIKIEKVEGKSGEEVTLSGVLALVKDHQVTAGTPFLAETEIVAKILKQGKAKKVIVFKYKPKKRYRVKRGHRQPFTLLEITKIKTPEEEFTFTPPEHPVKVKKAVKAKPAAKKAKKAAQPKFKKAAVKKAVSKKAEVKKAPAKKVEIKKAEAKKVSPKKAAEKPKAEKKAAPKKPAEKKPAAKKAAPPKSSKKSAKDKS